MRLFVERSNGVARRLRGRFVIGSLVAIAALLGGLVGAAPAVAGVSPAAVSQADPITVPSAHAVGKVLGRYPAGKYIVTLRGSAAASYDGGTNGFPATRPLLGKQISAASPVVKKYRDFLKSRQTTLATKVGVKATYNYTLALNGFAATLTSSEAARLAKSPDVLTVTPNEILKVQAQSSIDFLKIDTAGGLWSKIGGASRAGQGVVIGDIDTGIAPENPSFRGSPLTTTPSSSVPYVDSSHVVHFTKSNGHTFTSTEVTGDQWNAADYSTKIIAAHYYLDGFGADNIGSIAQGEYVSPRDGDTHGSHTASTAAGDYNVAATVNGRSFGRISGVAPAAKLAVYKACWSGPDPASEADDGCASSDLVAAIEQAISDGVDVINYSIAGGSATSLFSPTDAAFFNAAAAGIFVAAAAGNTGPGASTLDNAAPWETTVAASTIPSYEATAVLGNGKKYVGASVSVTTTRSAPLVLGSDIPAAGKSAAAASNCGTGTLNPAKAAGKIVVCDREGVIARTEKSATVAAAHGVGMLLVNTTPSDTDADFHAVPTIHVDAANRSAIRAYVQKYKTKAKVTFTPGNVSGHSTPVPQIASFSSRGPVLADGSSVLKPDISAPGVSILAAASNSESSAPQWAILSGTSMATPHIAGLAALYLGHYPGSSPSEIKSAMMTTATSTKDAKGHTVTNPFAQGAGEVKPTSMFSPGLYYLAGAYDWARFLVGVGEIPTDYFSDDPGDPSQNVPAMNAVDLNQPSIAVGSLSGSVTVHRSVTAGAKGTWKASAKVSGVKVKVSPSTLKFTAAGQTKTFTVTFTRTNAKMDRFATGSLTWKSGSKTAKSPIVVRPTSLVAATRVSGTGTGGTVTVQTLGGAKQTIALHVNGLAAAVMTPNAGDPSLPYTDVASIVGTARDYVHHIVSGTPFVRFGVQPVNAADPHTDLDLVVYYSPTESTNPADFTALAGYSATSSATEAVDILKPKAGYYLAEVQNYALASANEPYRESVYLPVVGHNVGNLRATPTSIKVTAGRHTSYQLRWGGLAPHTSYVGLVQYGSLAPFTVVQVTTGATLAPVKIVNPALSGVVATDTVVTAGHGGWDAADAALDFTCQWLRDGVAIDGATGPSYTPTVADDFGHLLSARLTAQVKNSAGPATTATTAQVRVKSRSTTTFSLPGHRIHSTTRLKATIRVVADPAAVPLGKVAIKYGSHSVTATLKAANHGVITITLPKFKKGRYSLVAVFGGSGTVGLSSSAAQVLTVGK